MKELLELVELKGHEDIIVAKLSGGMKKRLDLACSLLHSPEILILDEPDSGLDPITRKKIWDIIQKINQQGTTILLT
jgi:ABC-2 type transport system ATP-binding protein